MEQITVTAKQAPDEQGDLEEFSFDLLPVVDDKETVHLGENGLPREGTTIVPGMIVIGGIGKSTRHDPRKKMTCLDLHSMSFDELKAKYGYMWVDMSVRADASMAGKVVRTWRHEEGGIIEVGVVIERSV